MLEESIVKPTENPPEKPNRLRRWVGGFLIFVVVCLGGLYGGYRSALKGLPKLDSATDYEPFLPSVFYDAKGRVVAEYGEQRRIVVPYATFPKHVVQAFLASEDASFFSHGGVNIVAILRAAMKNFTSGKVRQGASTITQQVAKTFFLSNERTLLRKVREVALAYKLEAALSKEDILFLYLNQIYFGAGAYGVESASNIYFGKHITDVTVAEAAILAGLPKAPSAYSPYDNPQRARQRQLYVIDQMIDNGFLSKSGAEAAKSEAVAIRRWQNPSQRIGSYGEQVRRYLVEKYGEETVLRGGLRVEIGMDLDFQLAAQNAVQKGVVELEMRHGYRGPISNVAQSKWDSEIGRLEKEVHRVEPGDVIRYIGGAEAAESDVVELPRRPVQALVKSVTAESAVLAVGKHRGILPLFEAHWAIRYGAAAYAAGQLKDLRKALHPGDIILVQLFDAASLAAAGDKKRLEKWKQLKPAPAVWWAALLPNPKVQSALLATDPRTAEIRAMVGAYDFFENQFNRALQARRQPGSAFKPIVYAAALARGYTPATMVVDSPDVYINMSEDSTAVTYWKPKNYDDTFFGPITFREALVRSRNVPTLRISQDIGIESILEMSTRLGITSPLERNFSISLGSSGVSLFELATAYTAIDAGGVRRDLKMVRRVVDRKGVLVEQQVPDWVIENREPTEAERAAGDIEYYKAEQALDRQTAFIMTYLLRSVVQNGTGWKAREVGRPAGGKTGTTNDNVDSWFVGFTPELMAGVWVGYDEAHLNLGPAETGSLAANPIWNDFIRKSLEGQPVKEWPVPERIIFKDIDTKTGLLAGPSTEKTVSMPFVYGTEPSSTTGAVDTNINDEELMKLDMGF